MVVEQGSEARLGDYARRSLSQRNLDLRRHGLRGLTWRSLGVVVAVTGVAWCAATAGRLPNATAATAAQSVSGSVQSTTGGYLTVSRAGTATGVMAKLIAAANRIANANYPYVWGGGHGRAGVPTRGTSSRNKGYDCSGAVAAALVAAGLWPSYDSVPNEAQEIRILRSLHLIARGAGTGPTAVTLYDDPGVHIFMNVDGRFWGTSDGGAGANSKGGPGWLHDGAVDVRNPAFQRWHFVASALKVASTAGLPVTFTATADPTLVLNLLKGDHVAVTFTASNSGILIPKVVTLGGEATVSGTVTAVGIGGSGFTIELASGAQLTLTNVTGGSLSDLAVGDEVTVTYTTKTVAGITTDQARAVTVVEAVNTTPSRFSGASSARLAGDGAKLSVGRWS